MSRNRRPACMFVVYVSRELIHGPFPSHAVAARWGRENLTCYWSVLPLTLTPDARFDLCKLRIG